MHDILIGNITHQYYSMLKTDFHVQRRDLNSCVDMMMSHSQLIEKPDSGGSVKNIQNAKGGGGPKILNYEVDEYGNVSKKQFLSFSDDLKEKFSAERNTLRI